MFGQAVSINATGTAPNAESILDVASTTKGVLLPRMTTAQRTGFTPTTTGMTVYDITTESYWYWDDTANAWREIPNTAGIVTTLDGAYDGGGSGVGRSITVDAGSVQMNGTGGSVALETDGDIQLAEDQWVGLGSTIERIEFDGSLNRIDIEGADVTMDDGTWIGVDGSSPRIEFEDASGRLNMQDADIELDPGAWIGVGSSVERIEFDGANGEVNVLGAEFGINTTAPTEQLDVNGQIRMRTGATLNYIPVGDASGVMTWTDPATLGLDVTTASNGLTEVSDDIQLGGTLSQNTTVAQGAFTLDFTATSVDGFSVDGTTFSVDASNNRVGIGTSTPAYELDVTGGINLTGALRANGDAGTAGQALFSSGGGAMTWQTISSDEIVDADGDTKIQVEESADEDRIRFDTFGSERMIIMQTGNVGIGNSLPDYLLDIAGDVGLDNRLYHNDDTNTYIEFTPDRIQMFAGSGTSSWIDIQSSASEIAVNENNLNRDFRIEGGTDANLFFVDGSANFIGVATNAPSVALDVNGQIRMRTGATAGYIPVGDANGVMIWTDPSTITTADVTLDEAYDGNGPGLGRTITADNGAVNIEGADGLLVNGNVGIGTLTPYTKLRVDVQASGFNVPLVVRNSGTNTNGDVVGIGLVNESVDYGNFYKAAMVQERTAGFGVGKLHFLVDDAGDANSATLSESRMTILPNGNVGIGTTAPSVKFEVAGDATISGKFNSNGIQESSDIRFKKNINTLQNSLENVLKLEGVSYNWKVEDFPSKNFSDRTEIGVIAQEVEKVYPELVSTDANGYKAVQYSHLVPVLIEAIKEQNQIISSQSLKLNQLNADNNGMSEDIDYLKAQIELLHDHITTSDQ